MDSYANLEMMTVEMISFCHSLVLVSRHAPVAERLPSRNGNGDVHGASVSCVCWNDFSRSCRVCCSLSKDFIAFVSFVVCLVVCFSVLLCVLCIVVGVHIEIVLSFIVISYHSRCNFSNDQSIVCIDSMFIRLSGHVTRWSCDRRLLLLRLCFMRLKLLLIAIETKREDGSDASIAINPGSFVKVEATTHGFFIAQSADEVKR